MANKKIFKKVMGKMKTYDAKNQYVKKLEFEKQKQKLNEIHRTKFRNKGFK